MFGIDDALMAAIIPSVAGIGGSLMGNLFNQSNAKEASQTSQDMSRETAAFNAEQYAKRYQTTTADMKAAGLNPIMAASGGFSVGNSPTQAMPQTFQAPPVEGFSSSAKSFGELSKLMVEKEKAKEETKNIIADTAKKLEETQNTIQDTLKKREETGLAKANERNAVQNLINLQLEAQKSIETIQLLKEQTLQAASQAGLNSAQKWQAIANEHKILQETRNLEKQHRLLEVEVKRVAAIDDVYGNEGGAYLTIFGEVMKKIMGK